MISHNRSAPTAAAISIESTTSANSTVTCFGHRSTAIVQRYGGTVDKSTGDGFMPIVGAPTALEDHAFRACLAALGIQIETHRLAADTQRHDGIMLQLRIGLNSGEVIAGEIGSGTAGYTAVGEQAGMAQGMESVAPPGGVMLSKSTMRLIENAAILGDPEAVHIKGFDYPVRGRRLLMWQRNGERPGGTSRPWLGAHGK
jgi:adenylate cyclase